VLIEKDWLGMGHKFAVRLGHNQKGWFSDGMSPVFIQFLDCVYQLLQQYPAHFEFNERYLMDIVDAAYSGRDGTFLFETDRDRYSAGVRYRTPTTWDFLLNPRSTSKYTNPLYRGGMEWKLDQVCIQSWLVSVLVSFLHTCICI
jgi:myotubularin-related protein 1/2